MKCEITDRDQRIDDFLLAKLSSEDADAFEIHLFGCPECFEELRLRERMVKLIKEERVTAVEEYARQRSPQKPVGLIKSIADFLRLQQNIWIYAGATVVLLIGFLMTKILLKRDASEVAANFAESPYLESIMQQTFQSSDLSVSVISPAIAENFDGQIQFRWEATKDGEPFTGSLDLKIMNNQGTPVYTANVEGGAYVLTQPLPPGLYYWTLEEQGQMLYLGKFFFQKPTQ